MTYDNLKFISILLLFMSLSLSAQEAVEYGPDVFIDIDGIQIGDELTKEDMVSHFGELISEKREVYWRL